MHEKTTTIHRIKFKEENYTKIGNGILQDPDLSFLAIGIAAQLLSRPPDWLFSAQRLRGPCKEGLHRIRRGIKELEEAGYIERRKLRNEKGHFETVLHLFEQPTAKKRQSVPTAKKPTVGEPTGRSTEGRQNVGLKNSRVVEIKDVKTNDLPHSPTPLEPHEDDALPEIAQTAEIKECEWGKRIFDAYPKRQMKPKALTAISKAIERGHGPEYLLERTQAFADAVKGWPLGDSPRYVPNPVNWFNEDRFQDDPDSWDRGHGLQAGFA